MHGLINRAIQNFVRDAYGQSTWRDLAAQADLGPHGFETMLVYDDALTWRVLSLACTRLEKPRDAVLEDLGTHLVSHPNMEALRRLLRFGGVDFLDFLHSLDDLPDRARLAVPDLDLPALELCVEGENSFELRCRSGHEGFGHVLVGVLRAMADDYGALALIEHAGADPRTGEEVVTVDLMMAGYTSGREFDLAVRAT